MARTVAQTRDLSARDAAVYLQRIGAVPARLGSQSDVPVGAQRYRASAGFWIDVSPLPGGFRLEILQSCVC